jgi:methionyl-tRNA formyltransferase
LTNIDKENTRVLFMGTPQIAADCLKQLIDDGFNIAGVFTREDKPVGRKHIITAPPVKKLAQEYDIPVYQPKTLKGEYSDKIKEIAPDLIIVVAYGRILPKKVIDIPKLGCLNLHVSLLPKYRGAAPIQWRVINGEKKTGVTVMQIDEGLDTGDIIDVLPVDIGENDTSEDVFNNVAELGKNFLSKTAENVISGNFKKIKQDESLASYAPPLEKEMGLFKFSDTAQNIHNKVRGMYPWPSAYFMCEDKKIKVNKTLLSDSDCSGKVPGTVISLHPLTVATGEGAVQLLSLSPQGGRTMDGTSWANGKRLKKNDVIPR